jgi:hypothetical protein
MITMSSNDLGEFWTRLVEQPDSRTILAAAAVGLAVAWRILRWQHRARVERRLQAAAAAYAARELALERQPVSAGFAA